jgi:hypothetical protein
MPSPCVCRSPDAVADLDGSRKLTKHGDLLTDTRPVVVSSVWLSDDRGEMDEKDR